MSSGPIESLVSRVRVIVRELSSEGKADAWGGMESRRILADLLADPAATHLSTDELRERITEASLGDRFWV